MSTDAVLYDLKSCFQREMRKIWESGTGSREGFDVFATQCMVDANIGSYQHEGPGTLQRIVREVCKITF